MLFSLAMVAESTIGQVAPEKKASFPSPRIYRLEDIRIASSTMHPEIKGKFFTTDVCLPIQLNGHVFHLPIVPILGKDGQAIGKYFCWLDPHPDRNLDLANDGSVELSKLLLALPPEKTVLHSPPTGKSSYMTRNAIDIAQAKRKFSEIVFKEALFEGSKSARDGSSLAVAKRYFPVTAQENGKVMGIARIQAAFIQNLPVDSHAIIDDIVSLGATQEKMKEIIREVALRKLKIVDVNSIPTVALGIEVEDIAISTGYVPRPNVYAAIVIPEITRSVIRTSSGIEIDLRELTRPAR